MSFPGGCNSADRLIVDCGISAEDPVEGPSGAIAEATYEYDRVDE